MNKRPICFWLVVFEPALLELVGPLRWRPFGPGEMLGSSGVYDVVVRGLAEIIQLSPDQMRTWDKVLAELRENQRRREEGIWPFGNNAIISREEETELNLYN